MAVVHSVNLCVQYSLLSCFIKEFVVWKERMFSTDLLSQITKWFKKKKPKNNWLEVADNVTFCETPYEAVWGVVSVYPASTILLPRTHCTDKVISLHPLHLTASCCSWLHLTAPDFTFGHLTAPNCILLLLAALNCIMQHITPPLFSLMPLL